MLHVVHRKVQEGVPERGGISRAIGLAVIFLVVILSLSTMRPIPAPRDAFFPDWWRPAAESEPRLRPLDWNAPLDALKPLIYYSDETGVPVWIGARMFSTEASRSGHPLDANWRRDAESYMGAKGYAQLMPQNIDMTTDRGRKFAAMFNDGQSIDAEDPVTSIRVGIRYLAYLHKMLGRWRWAVEAYNVGPGGWLKAKRFADLPAETQGYSIDVMGRRAA